ncbi:hypothetical protein CsSME_00047990 [Camellia sinensis var. sinensis]
MGSQILQISPGSYFTTLIFNHNPLSRSLLAGKIHNTQLTRCSSKPTINPTVSPSRVSSAVVHRSKRSFRGSSVVAMATPGSARKSEEEWQAILSPEQFRILRQKGTEYPGTGVYDKFFGEGVYTCAGCGTPLYSRTQME